MASKFVCAFWLFAEIWPCDGHVPRPDEGHDMGLHRSVGLHVQNSQGGKVTEIMYIDQDFIPLEYLYNIQSIAYKPFVLYFFSIQDYLNLLIPDSAEKKKKKL